MVALCNCTLRNIVMHICIVHIIVQSSEDNCDQEFNTAVPNIQHRYTKQLQLCLRKWIDDEIAGKLHFASICQTLKLNMTRSQML